MDELFKVKTRHKKALKEIVSKKPERKKRSIIVRLIGGLYPNKKLYIPKTSGLRPTLTRAKVVLFDTLKFEQGWSMLDVFAGSGAIGLEALSRGASTVVLFEMNANYVKAIDRNIKEMPNVTGTASVFKTNAFKPLRGRPMNVVFLDPPYKDSEMLPDLVNKLEKFDWIDHNTIVITETDRKKLIGLPDYEMFNEKFVASTNFRFWKKPINVE